MLISIISFLLNCALANQIRINFSTLMIFSRGELLTFDWLCHQIGWPFSPPDTILDLVHLEAVHDVFDLYLWLSYRFPVSLALFLLIIVIGCSPGSSSFNSILNGVRCNARSDLADNACNVEYRGLILRVIHRQGR